jgi:imidazolonepropionase-like amidohydrolase
MKKKILCWMMILLLAAQFRAQSVPSESRPLVFTNVTVIDVLSGKTKPGTTVIVSGNRITNVGKKVKIPKDAQIIDASGKFLIPSLWDMHIHSFTENGWEWLFPLLIANGVTGVRELGTRLPFERINQLRRETLEGKILGPRYGAVTARVLDGTGSQILPQTVVETAEQARSLVREYKQQGMDFIKVYNLLSREVYLAIIDEAKRQKIPVAGHVPFSMTASEVSDLGHISIEHFTDIFLSCSRDENALREERRQELAKGSTIRPASLIETRAAATYDEQKAAALAARFRRNGTWWCPTIILSGTVPAERRREGDSRLKYIPTLTQETWRNAFDMSIRVIPNADDRKMRYQRKLEIVGLMHRAGVRLLAGTDAPNPYVFPGFGLHEELELFVQAGLSPLEALQTATVNPAKFLGKEKELGTIEKGKLADLVLLEASPLEDIKNTMRIAAVVANGKYLPKTDLQKLLSDVEAANSRNESNKKQSVMFDFGNRLNFELLSNAARVCE